MYPVIYVSFSVVWVQNIHAVRQKITSLKRLKFYCFFGNNKNISFRRTRLARGSWWALKASQWTETATSSWSTTRPAASSSFSSTASWSPSSVTAATVTDSLQVHSMVICALPPTVVLQPAHTCMWNEVSVKPGTGVHWYQIHRLLQGPFSQLAFPLITAWFFSIQSWYFLTSGFIITQYVYQTVPAMNSFCVIWQTACIWNFSDIFFFFRTSLCCCQPQQWNHCDRFSQSLSQGKWHVRAVEMNFTCTSLKSDN